MLNFLGSHPPSLGKITAMSKTPTFEHQLAELSAIIEKMEQPDVGLEESLKLYEQGVQLTRTCQKIIDDAETRIKQLMEQNN